MTRSQSIAGRTVAVAALSSLMWGCGGQKNLDEQGTPSTYTVSTTPAQIQAIQNDPNIPPDRKDGMIAALKGDKSVHVAPPPGAAPPYATAKVGQ